MRLVPVQVVALVYGVTVIYSERPYFNVFAVDRFAVLAKSDVDQDEWNAALAAGRVDAKPWRGPVLVIAKRPTELAADQRLLEEVLAGKRDIDQRPEFWSRYEKDVALVVAKQRPLTALSAARPESASAIAALAARFGSSEQRLGFVPMLAKNRDVSLVVDAATGEPLDVIAVDPWIR
jgi:hypothetical protein